MSDDMRRQLGWFLIDPKFDLRKEQRVRIADAILEKFDVTVKPEPPVISDEELGSFARDSTYWENNGDAGADLREALASRGLEIVRKAETE